MKYRILFCNTRHGLQRKVNEWIGERVVNGQGYQINGGPVFDEVYMEWVQAVTYWNLDGGE